MVIASSDKYNKMNFVLNTIEVYGTRLIDGPSLVTNIDGESKELYVCDSNEIGKANVADDYPVVAEYILTYSNDKFEFTKVKDIETLLDIKTNCNNQN